MSRATDRAHMRMLIEEWNEEMRFHFEILHDKGKHNYSKRQKDYAFHLVDTYGVRATSRILQIPRRTIQRWCRKYGKRVRRCPDWVYEWAGIRRKWREFWKRKGYLY